MLEFNISAKKKTSQENIGQPVPNAISAADLPIAQAPSVLSYNKAVARREKVKKALEDGKKVYFRFLSIGTTWVNIPNSTGSINWLNQWPTQDINEAQFKIEAEGILQ